VFPKEEQVFSSRETKVLLNGYRLPEINPIFSVEVGEIKKAAMKAAFEVDPEGVEPPTF
jgi:hypothetical protein